MKIASILKLSLVDYPGKLAAVVFTNGCNYDCIYCHNRRLIDGRHPELDNEYIADYLTKRRSMLDAVVITGGEPTIQNKLIPFMSDLKSMGYFVKLDTNGSRPDVLSAALEHADYVAVDYKAPALHYPGICGADADNVIKSLRILGKSTVAWEVRTTLAESLMPEDIDTLKAEIVSLNLSNPPILHRFNPLNKNINREYARE